MPEITIFVLGLDDQNHAVLREVPGAERYRFLSFGDAMLLDRHA